MVFIETPVFTRQVGELLSDEEYAEFQQFMADNPNAGAVLSNTNGLRKIRWTIGGRGKRGGVRVIYFHAVAEAQLRMLLIYSKGAKDDLSPKEKKTLREINRAW
jgi:hypothetical protein